MVEVNIDNIATDLNAKLGKSELVRYPISKYVSSDNLTWYVVYSDGWKEYCGIAKRGTAYTFTGISFSDANYSLQLTYKYVSSNATTSSDTPIKVTAISGNGFTWNSYHTYSTTASIYACGY